MSMLWWQLPSHSHLIIMLYLPHSLPCTVPAEHLDAVSVSVMFLAFLLTHHPNCINAGVQELNKPHHSSRQLLSSGSLHYPYSINADFDS